MPSTTYLESFDIFTGKTTDRFASDYAEVRPTEKTGSDRLMFWLEDVTKRVNALVDRIENVKPAQGIAADQRLAPASVYAQEAFYIYKSARELNLSVYADQFARGRATFIASPPQIARVIDALNPEDARAAMVILAFARMSTNHEKLQPIFAQRLQKIESAAATALKTPASSYRAAEDVLALLTDDKLSNAITADARTRAQQIVNTRPPSEAAKPQPA